MLTLHSFQWKRFPHRIVLISHMIQSDGKPSKKDIPTWPMEMSHLPKSPLVIGAGTTELKVLRIYGETLNRLYLLYFLESPQFIEEATFKGTANQKRIVNGYIENKLFPLPPYKEQQRIVQKINDLLAKL